MCMHMLKAKLLLHLNTVCMLQIATLGYFCIWTLFLCLKVSKVGAILYCLTGFSLMRSQIASNNVSFASLANLLVHYRLAANAQADL